MFSALAVAWLTLDLIGGLSLLLLLGTFAVVKTLPQRNNPFLVNLLLTTFLAIIPPCLLFFAGQQSAKAPVHWLCVTQSILMDGVAPMFGVALLVLIFQVWAVVMAIDGNKACMIAKNFHVKWLLLLAPYVAAISWCTASLANTLQPLAQVELSGFMYCHNESQHIPVRKWVGPFMIMCGIVGFGFEISIAYLIYHHSKCSDSIRKFSSASYRENVHLFLRLFIFSILQLTPIILAVMNKSSPAQAIGIQNATQIVESTGALVTFLVFGTQRPVLEVWRILQPSKGCGDMEIITAAAAKA